MYTASVQCKTDNSHPEETILRPSSLPLSILLGCEIHKTPVQKHFLPWRPSLTKERSEGGGGLSDFNPQRITDKRKSAVFALNLWKTVSPFTLALSPSLALSSTYNLSVRSNFWDQTRGWPQPPKFPSGGSIFSICTLNQFWLSLSNEMKMSTSQGLQYCTNIAALVQKQGSS